VRVALPALAGAAWQRRREVALDQLAQRGLELLVRLEPVHALGPRAELAGRLWPAQHQHGEERELRRCQAERLVEHLLVLDRARRGPAGQRRPLAPAEPVEGGADGALVVVDDRVAVRRLVAGQAQ
jgi:hypothetical protein